VKELGLGIMINSFSLKSWPPDKHFKEVCCALDNGAFNCYRKGYPFQADVFFDMIKHCYKLGIVLDFIVCPDIMCAGEKSFQYSMEWAKGELLSTPNLALVVQDGMEPKGIKFDIEDYFTHIFVGGSVDWKWKTAKEWVKFSHDNNMKCHIGQCGQLEFLKLAHEYNADSVDSSSIVRNGSWDIINQFRGGI
jgi:hypothetical protein|tara:strand:- start:418 stop:993 length:576 start_codon:yes stop_codon:yes gene_type:complete